MIKLKTLPVMKQFRNNATCKKIVPYSQWPKKNEQISINCDIRSFLSRLNILAVALLILSTNFITITALAQQKLKPGQSFKDCFNCPVMVVIPAGKFTMGSPENEDGHSVVEGPQKSVSVGQFAAAKFDVTLGQWQAFVKATSRPVMGGCAFSGFKDTTRKDWDDNPNASWRNLGFTQDSTHPVVCITWNDAQDYVKWLSKKTGYTYRLLTEAEWEYAARAGTTTAYPWGTAASHEFANYGADSGWTGMISKRDKWMCTSPVGSFPPNEFGLYDMQGNVLQYVEDCFSASLSDVPADGSAYKTDVILKMTGRYSFMNGKRSCDSRMVRGGDWGDPPQMIRSGFRNWAPGRGFTIDNYRSGGVGFRVARIL
ncbi:formylglycine-generating enzyme family protein [Mucilaginibacter gilvus]|uniref:Formylglycine-generating enzyme family protein n=2 Tax=Mucilaginibacter gilvus TaxID=2305909 RepID=A0A444MTI7_9SPHI|nr:formylglycine-generating enzyme family protein [Mucilaginibacter gilvus]